VPGTRGWGTVHGVTNTCSMTGSERVAGVSWTPTLFDVEPVDADGSFGALQRFELAHDAWVDYAPGWLRGAAAVFDELVEQVPWRSRRRLMYGQFVEEPRLHHGGREAVATCPVAAPAIDRMATLLSRHYGRLLPDVGLNYYRHGQDSVAWHGDRVGRDLVHTIVAVVSVGGHRPFRLRPREGGETREFLVGGGDLLVMGGACQRTWYHAVPKVREAPPRISITFRPAAVAAS
jgi:alkylated DNA repair dioxygenase AlkB